jgi:hypothetical protein
MSRLTNESSAPLNRTPLLAGLPSFKKARTGQPVGGMVIRPDDFGQLVDDDDADGFSSAFNVALKHLAVTSAAALDGAGRATVRKTGQSSVFMRPSLPCTGLRPQSAALYREASCG